MKGWDNFPRLLLMFHATVLSSPESYFQTLVCNSKFKTKVVNTSLRFNEFAEFSQVTYTPSFFLFGGNETNQIFFPFSTGNFYLLSSIAPQMAGYVIS